jgi:type VI secretion system ImpM family protein
MSALAVAFYGKIASQADFVRINAGAFAQAGWDAWFQEGVADLQRRNLRLPPEPVGFVLSSQDRLCAGAFAPGQDALSRSFPAIVSIETPAPPVEDLAAWRHQRASFFAASGFLALHAPRLTTAELAGRMLSVGSRLEDPLPRLATSDILAAANVASLTAEDDLADIAYGLTTTISACAEARSASPELPARVLTLYGPARTELERTFWIELAGRHLGHVLPSLFWTKQSLVLALGPPPPAALACLADPGRAGSRFWPLRTCNPSARAAAIAKLTPAQAHVLGSPGASLAHVLSVFSREPL